MATERTAEQWPGHMHKVINYSLSTPGRCVGQDKDKESWLRENDAAARHNNEWVVPPSTSFIIIIIFNHF